MDCKKMQLDVEVSPPASVIALKVKENAMERGVKSFPAD